MKVGCIYLITNKVNGKQYVGQTRMKLITRYSQHFQMAQHHPKRAAWKTPLSHAIRKYGREAFEVQILETCPLEVINSREIFWIAQYNSYHGPGYNATAGGHTATRSAESYRLQGDRMRGKKLTGEWLENIRRASKCKKPPSRESIEKMRATKLSNPKGNSLKVHAVNPATGEQLNFVSANQCAKHFNVASASIKYNLVKRKTSRSKLFGDWVLAYVT